MSKPPSRMVRGFICVLRVLGDPLDGEMGATPVWGRQPSG